MSKVLLAPLDPVHDVGLKMIARGLEEAGYDTLLLPPDLSLEEVIDETLRNPDVDTMLLSRTLGYGVGELLGKFIDMCDAAGIRENMKIGIGGMAIRPELAAELGFDGGFGPGTTVEQVICFINGKEYVPDKSSDTKEKRNMTTGYDYTYKHSSIAKKLDAVTSQIMKWAGDKTSPGVQRAILRDKLWDADEWRSGKDMSNFFNQYVEYCDEIPANYYKKGEFHPKTRPFTDKEIRQYEEYVAHVKEHMVTPRLQRGRKKPLIFNQYGTGCPIMDAGHIMASEAWGADGVVHFDPSWGARTEGFLDGFLTHQEDGTVITPANLDRIRQSMQPSTIWQVRAHRGLNTPETVVLAGKMGAAMTKINICYGALGAGTDPARLTVDGYHAIKYAQQYGLPFDIVTNEELCGVPAHKAFAGMLIVADLARKLGASPVLQPLFAYSPEAMIRGIMEDNYVDYNAAKIYALRRIINAPIWPGAPIAFLTQTEDRVQSAMTTALHGALATSLGVDAISIASTDEAYSGGPITIPSKVDTLRALGETFRFFGEAGIQPTNQAEDLADELVAGIEATLDDVIACGDFVEAMHQGCLGSRKEGAYPGRGGKGTVTTI